MKKTTIISMLTLLGMIQVLAYENESIPLVCEGVKWVNEHVTISDGDTTCYYYTYEIQGLDTTWHFYSDGNAKLCHYYTGNHIDYNNDSIISSLEEKNWYINCYNNWAFNKAFIENRTLLDHAFWVGIDEGECLYWYLSIPDETKWFILINQLDSVLTKDNLIEVDPIEIDGNVCGRLAYVKESGDTMCYVVESIGFDSRNMGDLLTPFMREPEPNADYQEYCGLCHVIKDGKIIYKGMRYNPDNMTGVDEVVADKTHRPYDPNYYNLMGQSMGVEVPATSGIYIHHGKKIVIK